MSLHYLAIRDSATVAIKTAPGIDFSRDALERAKMELKVADDAREMDPKLFNPNPIGLVR